MATRFLVIPKVTPSASVGNSLLVPPPPVRQAEIGTANGRVPSACTVVRQVTGRHFHRPLPLSYAADRDCGRLHGIEFISRPGADCLLTGGRSLRQRLNRSSQVAGCRWLARPILPG